MRYGRDIHREVAGTNTQGAYVYVQLTKRDREDMGCQVEMPICTDACTPSCQSLGPDGGLAHAHRVTKGCIHLHVIM